MCAPAFGGAMYFRRKTSAGRAYLQIVESRREGDQVRQQVIATLGRFEDLQASGQLERLLRSGARFAAKAMMLSAAADDAAIKIAVHRIGAALVFERLWEETGFRRAASRTWWRSGCSRIGATCSRGSTWCSWTPRASTSRAPAARRWASTATARTTALTCGR